MNTEQAHETTSTASKSQNILIKKLFSMLLVKILEYFLRYVDIA